MNYKILVVFAVLVSIACGRQGFGPGEQEFGYSEVRPGAHMFWWLYYTTAQVASPTGRPLVLWLQGGPGGSSTGYGNFEELGPLDVNLNPREFSWVKDVNVMFVDNPVGTGFSYVERSSLLTRNNTQIAKDLVQMMKDFYNLFPKFENTPLYITCESYGGKMVAEFALLLDQEIKKGGIKANFKGVGLGDSWISPIDSVLTWAPYLLNFGIVDQRGHDKIMKSALATKKAVENGQWETATDLWGSTEYVIMDVAHGIDFYNVIAEIDYFGWNKNKKIAPILPGSSLSSKAKRDLNSLMNGKVRAALGIIPNSVKWTMSSGPVFNALAGDFMKPVTHIVEQLLNTTNLKVFVFSGQLDLIVDTPGTVDWVERLRWDGQGNWLRSARDPLVANGIIEGFVKKSGNFGMYWVNRAGHMVPADNPAAMDQILRQLTNNYSGK